MDSSPSDLPLVGRRPVSPLLRAMLERGRQDLDPWLAGMNGVALAFLMIAFAAVVPEVDGSPPGSQGKVDLEEAAAADPMMVDLAMAPGVAPEEPEELPPPSPDPAAGQEVLDALDQPPVPPEEVWRDLPELIDPVVVKAPTRPSAPGPGPVRSSPPSPAAPRLPAGGTGPAPAAGRQGSPAGAAAAMGSGFNPQPPYPAFARRDRLQGTVVVSITVQKGAVASVRVVGGSGSAALDQYAVDHVQRRWKWPASISTTFTQPFRFVLK